MHIERKENTASKDGSLTTLTHHHQVKGEKNLLYNSAARFLIKQSILKSKDCWILRKIEI